MDTLKYLIVASLSTHIVSAGAVEPTQDDVDNNASDISTACETELQDAHRLKITQCKSVNASITTERGDSIKIESEGSGNSIVIRMGSADHMSDERDPDGSRSLRHKRSVEEQIQRLLKRRDRSPEAIQRHIDRLKERQLRSANSDRATSDSECIDENVCVDVETEYPIDELKLETSK